MGPYILLLGAEQNTIDLEYILHKILPLQGIVFKLFDQQYLQDGVRKEGTQAERGVRLPRRR